MKALCAYSTRYKLQHTVFATAKKSIAQRVQVANGQSSYVDFLICANVPDSDEEDNQMLLVDADNNHYYQNDDANGQQQYNDYDQQYDDDVAVGVE
eukprot:8179-Heterococcus_DN1.PRE.4